MQNPNDNPGMYTFRALAEQAQDPNVDASQIMQHLQTNMEALNHLQQQFGSLQNMVQEQAQQSQQANQSQAPLTSLHTTLEALAASHLEQQQLQQGFQASIQHILERLTQRSTGHQRNPIPQPLSTKFKGKDEELTFDEFKSKLQTTFLRFPDSLAADTDKIHYALQSMEGTPARYFAPYVNGDIPDEDGILSSYEAFIKAAEDIYGDKHQVDEVNHKLTRLRQNGSMTDYIATFRSYAARSRWNEPALLARFKDGLSDEIKVMMSAQWHSMTTLRGAQTAATTAYQNLQVQQRLRTRHGLLRTPHQQQPPRRPVATPNPTPANPNTMDLDAMRVRRISNEEKQRRREQNLCLYCGGRNHFVDACPAKKAPQLAVVSVDSENESA
jgi:hypothetical protein